MRISHVLVVLGVGAVSASIALGYEGDSGGSSSGSFTPPDSHFTPDTSPGSSGSSGDAGTGEAGEDDSGDSIVESTAPVALINMTAQSWIKGAASSDGTAIVISLVDSTILYSLYTPGAGWSTAAPIPSVTTTTTIRGRGAVAMDGKGNAFVAWATTVDSHNGFYVARYDHATKTWGAALQPDPYAENFADFVVVAANAKGDALATGLHAGATLADDLVVQHYDAAAGTWTSELVRSLPNGTADDLPYLQLADNGTAIVSSYPRTVALRSATGTWSVAPDPTFDVTSVSINEAGDALVAGQAALNVPYASRYDATTATWTAPVMISSAYNPTGSPACRATGGLQPNGDATYVRCLDAMDGSRRNMESYAYKKSTNAWSAVTLLDEAGQGPGSTTWAFDKAGNGVVVYEDFATLLNAAPAPAVMNTFTASTGTWSKQSAGLGGNSNRNIVPIGFLSPNGRGFAVWAEGAAVHAEKVR